MLSALPDISDSNGNTVLHCLADVGNVQQLKTLLSPTSQEKGPLSNIHLQQNDDGNSFLHVLAQKHNLNALFETFSENGTFYSNMVETLKKQNNNGKTFLAVAVDKEITETETQNSICDVLDRIADIFGEDTVSSLCEMADKKRNNLLHLAAKKSLNNLVSYILLRTTDSLNNFNEDGHKPLHVAVYKNDAELIRCILENMDTKNVNDPTKYNETALHIAAKEGNLNVLGELIRHGGDLSAQDDDEHTPLHDCLQQVYFEGGYEEERKCEKFIKVWNKVVQEAVVWWCKKQEAHKPLTDTSLLVPCQIKAVYFLRSCIKNKNGLSVLQYAADRGLVSCVQAMLATKTVFAIQENTTDDSHRTGENEEVKEVPKEDTNDNVIQAGDKMDLKQRETEKKAENRFKFKIDITNLSPEYGVSPTQLYDKGEWLNLKPKHMSDSSKKLSTFWNKCCSSNPGSNEENEPLTGKPEPEYNTFIEALAKVKPSNKAGEILELIPLITLTKLQWSVFQWFSLVWLAIHIVLMIILTHESRIEVTTGKKSFLLTAIMAIYAPLIFTINLYLRIRLIIEDKRSRKTPEHEVEKDDNGILNLFTKLVTLILDQIDLLVELAFLAFAWAVLAGNITNMGNDNYVRIKGFFLLFGWLLLLIPLRSYSPVYKLIAVLKYITITDMFPWILLYITISSGFASAIQLQFQLLPGNVTCLEEEHNLQEVLHYAGNALFELVIMTTGLDTDLKHVRNIACLFEYNHRSIHTILFLVTVYAILSAVVLLNMLIAIMSNTVTEAQQSKGWRQYQASSTTS